MISKVTSLLVLIFCYIITESIAVPFTTSEKGLHYQSTTVSTELDNTIAQNQNNVELTNVNKVNLNISDAVTDFIEIEPQKDKTIVSLSNNSAISHLVRAEDNVYKIMFLKCETCPDEVKEEKMFWDIIRQSKNLKSPSAIDLSEHKSTHVHKKSTKLPEDKNIKRIFRTLEVKDHGAEIEINKVYVTDIDQINTTDYRRYGVENIQTKNSENLPTMLGTNNRRLDTQMLNKILKLRNLRQYRLSVPGGGGGLDFNVHLRTSNVEVPPKPRRPDGPHGAGASIGTLFYDNGYE